MKRFEGQLKKKEQQQSDYERFGKGEKFLTRGREISPHCES